MACDTFIKIAQKCRRQFVQIQVGEVMPFIEELLSNINSIICDLQPQQVGLNSHFCNFTHRAFDLNFFRITTLCSRYYVCYTICRLFVLFCFAFFANCQNQAVMQYAGGHSLELCTGTKVLEWITGKPDFTIKSRFLFPYLKGVLTLPRKKRLSWHCKRVRRA